MIVYIDMDDVLCDYTGSFNAKKAEKPSMPFPQSQYGFFRNLPPIEGAVETVKAFIASNKYKPYILTAPSVMNPLCYTEKREWVERYLGMEMVERLIISPDKGLLKGDYLIDDLTEGRGQERFTGKLIHFGSDEFSDWNKVREYLFADNA